MSYEDELTATCLECGSDLDLVRLGKWQCAKCDLDELLEQARAEGRREELEPMECGHPCAAYVDEWQACGWCKEVEEARAEGAAAERARCCAAVCSWCRRGSKAVYREGYGWRHMVCDIQIDGDPIPVVYCQAAAIRASAEEGSE